MLSFLLESTYMAETLRDDRSGQKLNFQFYIFFCIWPPGGAMSLFTFSVFGHFDQLRIFFFHFFWLQQVPWVKPQHISKIQTGVFWFSHFMRQNVNKLLRIWFFWHSLAFWSQTIDFTLKLYKPILLRTMSAICRYPIFENWIVNIHENGQNVSGEFQFWTENAVFDLH